MVHGAPGANDAAGVLSADERTTRNAYPMEVHAPPGMQTLDIKRGHWKKVDLDAIMKENFDSYATEDGPDGTWYVASGPALKEFRLCMKDKSSLMIDITEDRSASMDDARAAIRLKNEVLEAATGFTAKQRAKRAQEAAKKAAG